MIVDKKTKHRNNPNLMSDAEIMVIIILFHSGGFCCFKYTKKYVYKHLKHLFPRQVSYNCFVELEKEVLLPMTIFIKKVLLGTCTGISFVDSTPLRVCRNQMTWFIKHLRNLQNVENKTTWGIHWWLLQTRFCSEKELYWNSQRWTEVHCKDKALSTPFFQQFHCQFLIGAAYYFWEKARHWRKLCQWRTTLYFLI